MWRGPSRRGTWQRPRWFSSTTSSPPARPWRRPLGPSRRPARCASQRSPSGGPPSPTSLRGVFMAVRVGINGFGRIGRNVLRAAVLGNQSDLEFVSVNDITDPKTLAHLLKYDSVHGRFPGTVEVKGDGLIVNGKALNVTAIKEPEKWPGRGLGSDLVPETTGRSPER